MVLPQVDPLPEFPAHLVPLTLLWKSSALPAIPSALLKCCWTLWLPRCLWSGFLRGWELHSAVGWAMIQLPYLGQGRPASRGGQALCLRTQHRPACVLPASLIRLGPPRLCRWTKQLQRLVLLLGHCREDSLCWLLLVSPHFSSRSDAQGSSPSGFPAVPVGHSQGRAPRKGPTVGAGYAPWALFSAGELQAGGKLSACCRTSLGRGQCSQRVAAPLSTSDAACLGVWNRDCFGLTPVFQGSLSGDLHVNAC